MDPIQLGRRHLRTGTRRCLGSVGRLEIGRFFQSETDAREPSLARMVARAGRR